MTLRPAMLPCLAFAFCPLCGQIKSMFMSRQLKFQRYPNEAFVYLLTIAAARKNCA